MTTSMHDELAVPHFEDRLWNELADAYAAGLPRRGRDRVMGDGRTRSRRRRRSVAVGLAAVAAAAAVTAGVVVAGDAGPRTTTGSDAAPGQPDAVDLAAEIIAATQQATGESVVHVFQDSTTIPDGEAWTDESSGRRRDLFFDRAGNPAYDSGAISPPTLGDTAPEIPDDPTDPSYPLIEQRLVDYCFAEYAEIAMGALPGGTEAALVGQRLADGSLVEGGTEVVDGRELIRLVEVPVLDRGPRSAKEPGEVWVLEENVEGRTQTGTDGSAPPNVPATEAGEPAPAGDVEIDESQVEHFYLVDPETYRPVMILGYPGTDAEYTMTFEYLPRTAENLALLVAPVPEGFVQVAELRGDGERFAAGCQ